MGKKVVVQGNEAAGIAALYAGCEAFFGYPITPVNEVTEWCSIEFPKRGKVYLQSASESGSIHHLIGAACVGARSFTATSGPGWGLMQDGISHAAAAQLPIVIYLCQRGGPGAGTVRHGQFDYMSACWGGGQGGHRNIVLAPASVSETVELMQLAFHLADKYRNPVIVLTDAVIGQMLEPVDLEGLSALDFGPLPSKEDWVLVGRANRADGKRRFMISSGGLDNLTVTPPLRQMKDYYLAYDTKWRIMEQQEVRSESYRTEDADLVIVAIGYTARVSREVVDWARATGLAVGMVRPITVAPFPYQVIREVAQRARHLLVVEDNLGQMVADVRIGAEGQASVHHLGCLERHQIDATGIIQPERVLAEVEAILGANAND